MTLINYKLQDINKIEPWGNDGNLSLHWFALTEGDLWISKDSNTIYEYSDQAIKYFNGKESKYNDFQISLFIEGFTILFEQISESIPASVYDSFYDFNSFDNFLNEINTWLQKSYNDDYDFYEKEYSKLTNWLNDRQLDSGHLMGGPKIWFFRHNDKIKIIWDATYKTEDGQNLWKSPSGQIELNYSDFKEEVKSFGIQFFNSMDNQVKLAIDKDFGGIKIDKKRLEEENKERKLEYFSDLKKLDGKPLQVTNWELLDSLTKEMRNR
jgi:hypothetical protein